jgi:hypothetical protein
MSRRTAKGQRRLVRRLVGAHPTGTLYCEHGRVVVRRQGRRRVDGRARCHARGGEGSSRRRGRSCSGTIRRPGVHVGPPVAASRTCQAERRLGQRQRQRPGQRQRQRQRQRAESACVRRFVRSATSGDLKCLRADASEARRWQQKDCASAVAGRGETDCDGSAETGQLLATRLVLRVLVLG